MELTDLHHETSEFEWVLPHQDSSSIPDHLGQAAQGHHGAKDPCSPLEAEVGVDEEGNGEEDEEDGVCC